MNFRAGARHPFRVRRMGYAAGWSAKEERSELKGDGDIERAVGGQSPFAGRRIRQAAVQAAGETATAGREGRRETEFGRKGSTTILRQTGTRLCWHPVVRIETIEISSDGSVFPQIS